MWETDFLCLFTCGITAICFSCNLTNNTKHEDCYNWYLNSPLDLVWLGKWHLGDVIGVGPNLKFTRLCRGWENCFYLFLLQSTYQSNFNGQILDPTWNLHACVGVGQNRTLQRGAVGEQFKQSAPWPFNQVIVSCVLYVTVCPFSSYESWCYHCTFWYHI